MIHVVLLPLVWFKNGLVRPILQSIGCGWFSFVGLEKIDRELVSLLDIRNEGVFIEVGANDGITQSNTYFLEKVRGWKGLLIEPLPSKAKLCRKNRRKSIVFNCALTSFGGPSKLTIRQADLMSVVTDGMDEEWCNQHVDVGRKAQSLKELPDLEVEAVPLQSLLDETETNVVHFFSLDVEGYELKVLRGINFETVRIENIFVEIRPFDEAEIDSLLVRHGYVSRKEWRCTTHLNRFYSLPPTC